MAIAPKHVVDNYVINIYPPQISCVRQLIKPNIPWQIKYRTYLTSLRCSTMKNLQMKNEDGGVILMLRHKMRGGISVLASKIFWVWQARTKGIETDDLRLQHSVCLRVPQLGRRPRKGVHIFQISWLTNCTALCALPVNTYVQVGYTKFISAPVPPRRNTLRDIALHTTGWGHSVTWHSLAYSVVTVLLTFWRLNYFFLILAHPVYKCE